MKKISLASIIALFVAIVVPFVFGLNEYRLRIFIMVFYFSIAAYGWDNIGGYAGQISIGNAAFFAVGAYSVAILFNFFKVPAIVGILSGAFFAAIIALVLGTIVLRLRGPYFTLSTLAMAEMMRILLLYFKKTTGGAEGIFLPYDSSGFSFRTLQLPSNIYYYYIGLGLLVIAFLVNSWVRNGRLGYKLASLRNDHEAAESIGINTMRTKVIAFVISGMLTALAGGFYMTLDRFVDPTSGAGVDISVEIMLIALVGGRRSKWGPLIGALILIPLTEMTNAQFGDMRAGLPMLVYSTILILVVMYAPDGVNGFIEKIVEYFKSRRRLASKGKEA